MHERTWHMVERPDRQSAPQALQSQLKIPPTKGVGMEDDPLFEDPETTTMVNTLTRIAEDLERILTGVMVSAGLLGLIAFLLMVRLIVKP